MIEYIPKATAGIRNNLHRVQDSIPMFIGLMVMVVAIVFRLTAPAESAGLNNVSVHLTNDGVSATSDVVVSFEVAGLNDLEVISIYLGDNSSLGHNWQTQSMVSGDVSCTDNGSGKAYHPISITPASTTVPMWTKITATQVGAGATTVTCTIGGTNKPKNPNLVGSYSISVVTTDDIGAGIAHVGNANNVTGVADVLPNLSLTIDNVDGSACKNASGMTACNLGIVTIAGVNEGNYDVNVGTNSANGASMYVVEDGKLRSGEESITDVVEGNLVTANTEGYGIEVNADATWALRGNFTDNDTPITGTPPDMVAQTTAPVDYSGDVTVTHRVAVSSLTRALTYSHVVTWIGTANF